MGQSLSLPADTERQVYIRVGGEDVLQTVTVVKNNRDYVVFHVDGASPTFTELFYDSENAQPTDWYYCRIAQLDGRMAWTSPIWIDAI